MLSSLFPNMLIRQYIAVFTSSLSIVVVGTMIGWPSPAIPKLKNKDSQVQLTDEQVSWMVSLLNLGNMISPIPSGYLMDLIGRKATLLHLGIFPLGSWYLLLTATKPYHIYIGRFLGGISFGVVYTVLPIYLAEISDSHTRGAMVNSVSMMASFGALIVYSAGPYVEYRSLIYVCLFMPIFFLLTFPWVPESPYYLVMIGNTEKAKKALTWLRCNETGYEILKELSIMDRMLKKDMKKSSTFKELIKSRGNRKALIIVQMLSISQRFTGIGIIMSYSSITIPKNPIKGMTFGECMVILGLVWFFGSAGSPFLAERCGRKQALVISLSGCGLTTLAATSWFYLKEKTDYDVEAYKWIPYISFLFHALFYSVGIGPVGMSLKAELFPTNVKGKASAITTIVLAMSAFILNKSYLQINSFFGMYFNFLIFTVSSWVTTIFVAFYVIETKAKSLDDIQQELHRFSIMSQVEDDYLY